MLKLWARLLANAMDPARAPDVRPHYINTLKEFDPLDAMVLQYLAEKGGKGGGDTEMSGQPQVRITAIRVSVKRLASLECVRSADANRGGTISDFGLELTEALRT